MKINKINTTSEAIKKRLEFYASEAFTPPCEPSAQKNHKAAAGYVALDILGIEAEADRKAFMAVWDCLPSSFACNASALNKALELETVKAKSEVKTAKLFADC